MFAEYFVIDAGWFRKNTNWASGIGNYGVENIKFDFNSDLMEKGYYREFQFFSKMTMEQVTYTVVE